MAPSLERAAIGIAGTGTMGAGIAEVAALGGHRVLLFDSAPGAAANAKERASASLERAVARGRIAPAQRDAALALLTVADGIDRFADVGLAIEAAVEDIAVKQALLSELEAVLAPEAAIATNTSSLSITAIAAGARRPERVCGMHFFNPAQAMKLVEIVHGLRTSAAIADELFELARRWGKKPVHCSSTPGFIVNRVARPFYGEALRLLEEGAAGVATIDAIVRECGGFRLGPFELMDLIGNDVNYAVTTGIFAAFGDDPRYRPSRRQRELVDAGWLGRKSGRGFYLYGENASHPEPSTHPPSAHPVEVVFQGNLGIAEPLRALAVARNPNVRWEPGAGIIRCDGVALALTDGRLASDRVAELGSELAVFDLALDYAAAPRIALAPARQTTTGALALACGFFQSLGKTVSVLNDVPGLAVMRTVCMLANEGADAVDQGVCTAEAVDVAMQYGVNYPCGPMVWAERIGPADVARVLDNLAAVYRDGRYRASPLLRRAAAAGTALLEVRAD